MNNMKELQKLTKNIHHWYVMKMPTDVKGMARMVLDVERHMNEVIDIYKRLNSESQLTPEIETILNECSEMSLAVMTAVSKKVTTKEIIVDYIKAYDALKESDTQRQKSVV